MRFLLAILLLLLAAPASAQQGQGMSQAMVVSSCGGGALPSGAVNQPTMDPPGRLCQSGAGSNICAEAAAYLGRTTGGTEGGNAANITTLICGLVADGVWSNLDAFYVLAQQNAADSLLNLVGASYALTKVGSPTFTSYVGYGGFSVSNYLNTAFNSTTATSPHYTQNSVNFGVWAYAINNEAGTSAQIGSGPGAAVIANNLNIFYYQVNDIGSASGAPGTTKGVVAAERTNSTTTYYYQNGSATAPFTQASRLLTMLIF